MSQSGISAKLVGGQGISAAASHSIAPDGSDLLAAVSSFGGMGTLQVNLRGINPW
jgi:hypothetical protein